MFRDETKACNTSLDVCRCDLIDEARQWLGTRYVHQGRLKGKGADCGGFLLGVCRTVGLFPHLEVLMGKEFRRYGRYPKGYKLKELCDEHLVKIGLSEVQPADIVLIKFERYPQHIAMITDYDNAQLGIIHVHSFVGQVVEHIYDDRWRGRTKYAYSIPGVEDLWI